MSKTNNGRTSATAATPDGESPEAAPARKGPAWSTWPALQMRAMNADGTPSGPILGVLRLAPGLSATTFVHLFYDGLIRPRLGESGINPVIQPGVEIELLETEQAPVANPERLTQGDCRAVVVLGDGMDTIHQLCGLIIAERAAIGE